MSKKSVKLLIAGAATVMAASIGGFAPATANATPAIHAAPASWGNWCC